jgi:hypothetical protein
MTHSWDPRGQQLRWPVINWHNAFLRGDRSKHRRHREGGLMHRQSRARQPLLPISSPHGPRRGRLWVRVPNVVHRQLGRARGGIRDTVPGPRQGVLGLLGRQDTLGLQDGHRHGGAGSERHGKDAGLSEEYGQVSASMDTAARGGSEGETK